MRVLAAVHLSDTLMGFRLAAGLDGGKLAVTFHQLKKPPALASSSAFASPCWSDQERD